jgi:hypothetical protein
MARMWPRQLPPDVLQNPRRSTEVAVYRKLASRLDDSWWAFYSRPWLGLTSTGAEKDGECDFILAHPKLGVLCLEVKGGAVAWYPETGQWTSRDRDGITHNIKDPVEQARSSKHELLKKLKQTSALRNRWITARHGVVLPGSVNPGRDLGMDRPLRLFCFADVYERDFGKWIAGRLQDDEGEERRVELGQDGLEALRLLLARPFQLKMSLGPLIRAEDRDIAFLTQQQFHLLDAIGGLPRVLIQGGAGTGKTVLAIHLAQTLAESGLDTLLVCYNRSLAEHMAARTAGNERLSVRSFHQLCLSVLAQCGVEHPVENGRGEGAYFDEDLPIAAEACASRPGVRKYDAVIVDEGQDFKDFWWLVLDTLLKPDGPGLLRVFADNNQRVYKDASRLTKDLQVAPIALSWNLRNTQAIHEAAYRHYQGAFVRCDGPAGEPPQLLEANDRPAILREVVRLVQSLTRQHTISPEEIAILVPDEAWREEIAPLVSAIGLDCKTADDARGQPLIVDTVRRFKGLEALVTIIIVTADLAANEELAYVALSRARTRTYLVGQTRHLTGFIE